MTAALARYENWGVERSPWCIVSRRLVPGAIQVDALELSTLRGLDLAFEVSREIEVRGIMPDGVQNTVRARIVGPEGFILIKAFALDERRREKDAYDVHFVLRHHEPNVEALAGLVRPLLPNGLAREGCAILEAKFATLDSVGVRIGRKRNRPHAKAREKGTGNAFCGSSPEGTAVTQEGPKDRQRSPRHVRKRKHQWSVDRDQLSVTWRNRPRKPRIT
ncbi:MAG: hypothetical protein U1E05_20565 [Patescibacteria group bacterium]|nr:hypothetical protein [Patescibacteria group bacterium]